MRRLFTAGLIALAMLAASPPVHALDGTDAVSFTGDTADVVATATAPTADQMGVNAPTMLPRDATAPTAPTAPTALEPIVPLPWCVDLPDGRPSPSSGRLLATKPGRLPDLPPPSEMLGRMWSLQRNYASAKFWVDLESGVTPSGLSQRRSAAA